VTELGQILRKATLSLSRISDTPLLDSQTLLAHVLDRRRSWVIAHPDFELSSEESADLESALQRLAQGEPLPYVIGQWEFFGMTFILSPAVLIPRPETELLVEYALAWLDTSGRQSLAADVGTGTGCIAVALACNNRNVRVIASDISIQALQVACQNIERHNCTERISCVQADLLPPVSVPFDLILANLPYIPTGILPTQAVYRKEPTVALDGGIDGLHFIRKLIDLALPRIAPGGLILMEIDPSQAESVQTALHQKIPAAEIKIVQDLAHLDRMVAVHIP
jgi:release factor glutamine methyltransferase